MASLSEPPDPTQAKLLMIHADDLGMTHSVNEATFTALENGAITSASMMAPCPWFPEAAEFARNHPGADLGVHLTLTCGWSRYRWGPISGRDRVPSLLDPEGYFWPNAQLLGEHVRVREAEIELHAQIEHALQSGFVPTHLDSHMFAHQTYPELFTAYRRIAREYRLPFLMVRVPREGKGLRTRCVNVIEEHPRIGSLLGRDATYPMPDAICDVQQDVSPARWKETYLEMLRAIKPGVSALIVHLGGDDPELRAVAAPDSPWGSEWRQRDFEVVSSPEFAAEIQKNGIHLVGWNTLVALREKSRLAQKAVI